MKAALVRWLVIGLAWVGLAWAGLASARAAPLDTTALKTIAPIEVIRLVTTRYWFIDTGDDDHRRKDLDEIGALAPEVRTLVWLAVLENGLTEQTEANDFAPSQLIGLERLYPQVLDALTFAGMSERAKAFAAATISKPVPDVAPGALPSSGSVDLGRAFGTKAEFDNAIVAYVRSQPKATAWLDGARAHLSDADRLRALLNMLWHQDAPDFLHTWPEPYRVLLLADMFDGEVGNGGVNQYFYNSSGDAAPAAVDAMRTLGLPKHADAIARGIALFPAPYPTDTDIRNRDFAAPESKDRNAALDKLTDVVGYDDVRPAMVAYAKQLDLLPR